jgi:UDP-glucose 4-epimerase
VFVSSGGAIYGNTSARATEGTVPRPASYYGIHKLAAEGHVELSGVDYAIARPSNIYGPRQGLGLEGAVVAAFADRALAGAPLTIHGDGLQTRDFVHVTDVADALVRLAGTSAARGAFNVARGRSISIAELANVVERAVGRPLERVWQPAREGDVRTSRLSPARLRALGWKPRVTLSRGLAQLLGVGPALSPRAEPPSPT